MTERRYDEDETRRIFDRASRAPALPPPEGGSGPAGGFTLAELQEIGAEAGIDPARVAEAARAISAAPAHAPAATRRVAGLPFAVSRTVELPGAFDDDAWNRLVVDLRETFDARGRIRVEGAFRAWTNGNLQALVEPHGDGHRLRLRTAKGSARRMATAGGVALAMALILLVVFALTGELAQGDAWVGPLFMGLMGAGFVGAAAVQLPPWARRRAEQMEEVAARARLRAAPPHGHDPSTALPGETP